MLIGNMNIDITAELIVFARFILSGVIVGVIVDIKKTVLKPGKDKFLTVLFDIVVWYLFSLIIFYYMYMYNDGQYRLYIVLSTICGLCLYKLLFSKLVKTSIKSIGSICIKIISLILKILLTPILFLYKIILYFKQKSVK